MYWWFDLASKHWASEFDMLLTHIKEIESNSPEVLIAVKVYIFTEEQVPAHYLECGSVKGNWPV